MNQTQQLWEIASLVEGMFKRIGELEKKIIIIEYKLKDKWN